MVVQDYFYHGWELGGGREKGGGEGEKREEERGKGRERKRRRRGGGGGREKGGGEGEERKREGIESKLLLYVAKKKSFLLTKTHALLSDARTVFAELHHTA